MGGREFEPSEPTPFLEHENGSKMRSGWSNYSLLQISILLKYINIIYISPSQQKNK